MSLLQNNTEALNRLRKITKAELEGMFGTMAPVNGKVVGALYNADTDGMKNILLHANPAGLMAGLKIAAVLTGASGAELVVREELDPQELLADAGMVDLPLTVTRAALINKMLYKQDKLFCLDELAAMADRLLGGQPGVLVSVDDGVPAEEPASRPVTELVGECKGILAGHSLYPAAKLTGLSVGDVAGRSGVIHRLTETSCPVHEAQAQLLALREEC